ncbi:MAG TPA: uridine diphosphate-N-acetylglucosamine-binding protein YvcK [Vicinamibacteria bacterium]|nr:uridine diphosphate-N-acetylglucosamine-binding protein YvcK [Vicinamibacteria bacterium]
MPAVRPPRVVAVGGGTGLPILLRGLREALFPPPRPALPRWGRERLTALVTVADDGGSSGRLRRAYGILAPGDVRNCLVALAEDPRMADVFDFRFERAEGLAGHSLGNLILAALCRIEDGFPAAVERAGELLRIRGRVLPATEADVRLLAELADGRRVEGESRLATARGSVRRLRLVPEAASALPEARGAIAAADLVVIGPGSLYTSLLPVLLVRGVAEEIARSGARVVLVMNLMTEPGETDGMTAADHVRALRRHAPGLPIHEVLLPEAAIPSTLLDAYAASGARPVAADLDALCALGCRPVRRRMLAAGDKVRHDPHRLVAAVLGAGPGHRWRAAGPSVVRRTDPGSGPPERLRLHRIPGPPGSRELEERP